MGGAYTSLADDFSATYYNMAGLIADKRIKVSSEFLYAQPYLEINSQDQNLPDLQGVSFGVSLPIPLVDGLKEKIAFGLSMFVFGTPDIATPQVYIISGKSPSSPKFVMYDNTVERLIITFGFAFELHRSLLIGAGSEAFGPVWGKLGTVESPNEYPEVSGRLGLYSIWSPHFGLIFKPGEISDTFSRLRIGLSYRDEFKDKINLPMTVTLGTLAFDVTLPTVDKFTPREGTIGIAYDFTDKFTLSFDLGFEDWSEYHSPVPHFSFDASLLGTTLGAALDVPREGFHDTWVPRIGGEYRYTSSPEFTWAFRAGYAYEPSPAPMQTGVSNYIDNDRHLFSLGLGVTAGGKYFENPMIIDIFLQEHYLKERKNDKDPLQLQDDDLTLPGFQSNNPGYPSSVSSGDVLSTGITLTFTF